MLKVTCTACGRLFAVEMCYDGQELACPYCYKKICAVVSGSIQLECPHCDGVVTVDAAYAGQVLACPYCRGDFACPHYYEGSDVLELASQDRPIPIAKGEGRRSGGEASDNRAPPWMKPAGFIAVALGGIGFLASASIAGGGTTEGALIAGGTNPLFFIGVPLGLYWLYRGGIFDGVDFFPLGVDFRVRRQHKGNKETRASAALLKT